MAKDTANIFLKGGTVLNVYSGELLKMNIAIKRERIWYVGPSSDMVGDDTLVLDAGNKVLVPGYIDPHFHPWFIYNPVSFGEEACRLGTTTLFCDNLIFYMLMGVELFERFMHAFSKMPIKFFWFCRAVPQTPMSTEDELFSVENLKRLLKNPHVQSLGEITRWPEILRSNPKIMEMISLTKRLGKRVDGHTAGAKYEQLSVLSRAGVESCHESISAGEVLDRLRLGLYVMLRESSLRQDLYDLLRVVTENRVSADRIMLTTDSSTPLFYHKSGITDHLLKVAIGEGIDPMLAYRMVTINPAVYFGMENDIGGIAPGRYADIVVLKDLLHPTPEMVISKGRIAAKNGNLIEPFPRVKWETFFPSASFSRRNWSSESRFFEIKSPNKSIKFPVIKLISSAITRTEWVEFDVEKGLLNLSANKGFCFLALINRDGRWVTNGILQGFGSVEGLASSFNTATEILAIGRNPETMSAAVNKVLEIKGGIVAIEKGKIVYEFPLPLGGIMSDAPMEQLAHKDRELKEFLSSKGYPFHDSLYTLVFLPNDFLPDVRINYQGVVDIRNSRVLWPRRDLK
ncbi:MAG: adenine deaminase C-terminal domain-containing protein [Thermodesulfobacteriota bacterium]|nr:adenine deaminase C-terminal domain-containing protein [Thermodesulfobacteriota bacterium]